MLPGQVCDRLHPRELHPAQSNRLQDQVSKVEPDLKKTLLLILRSRGFLTSSMNPLEVLLGRTTWAAASAEQGERVSDIEDEDEMVAL